MKNELEIAMAYDAMPIADVAASIGLSPNEIEPYGKHVAKVPLDVLRPYMNKPKGKLVLTTAITATPAGEGKTVTTIGLAQGLGRLGVNVIGCLREPSLGPTFGIKGGATGGGRSQVYPMWDIDLHFTGDIHAVGAAHNLLSAMTENHLAKGNELDLDPTKIVLRKALDMNCRELRQIVVGLGGRSAGGVCHESGFLITSASEISAIIALATSFAELRSMLNRIIVGYNMSGQPVRAEQMGCVGAMMVLLKDTLKPNLVQTLEGQPMFIHGFPFANIAHGSSSLIATKTALGMADVVLTEAGFAADLGAEKFFNIVCRKGGIAPDCAVLVASVRALKMHGGTDLREVNDENVDALCRGFVNLDRHVMNVRRFGVPVVVAINHFASDTDVELEMIQAHCEELGVRYAISEVYAKGGEGGLELAREVMDVLENEPADFQMLYEEEMFIKAKIEHIANDVYGAKDVKYLPLAERQMAQIVQNGDDRVPVCMAKTQASITDNPAMKGAPTGWTLTVREVLCSAGAGFVVPVCGTIMLIPGLPSNPAANRIDLTDDGRIVGLR